MDESDAQPARIRFQEPAMPSHEEIEQYFARSREERFFSNGGPCHRLLAQRLADRVGGGVTCVPVANATLGLLIALRALAGEPGRRRLIALPSFTFVAAAGAVRWAGFEPLFLDVDQDAWHLRPEELAGALDAHRGELAAVLACSAFGTPPPASTRRQWETLCRDAGVPLLVDSAAGFGAEADDGQTLGRQGDAEVFSFHATKPFAVGEGGLVVARDPDVAERVGQLANFGLGRGREVVGDPGLNAKLSELQCATALAVLDGYPEVLRARRASADTMRSALERAGCRFQLGCERATWQFVPVAVEADRRAGILDRASAGGVELRTYYEPLHRFPAFAHHPRLGDLAVTEDLGRRMVSLPMSNRLDDEARDRIVAVVALDSQPARRTPA